MKKRMKKDNIQPDLCRNVQFLLLLAVCAAEALFIALEGMFHYVSYPLLGSYIAVPALMFLGTALSRCLSQPAKRNLCLSGIALLWFVLAQIQHRTQGMAMVSPNLFILSYLMAFPFASVAEDGEKNIGMKLVMTTFLVASLILVGYSALLMLNCLPEPMQAFVYWDGTRLHPLWHSNTSACIFMIGIGASLSYMFHTGRTWKKVLLTASVALQFFAMSLTNCRTSLLMTCGMIGCAVFFALCRGGWKRFLAGAAAALLVIAALFATAGNIYGRNRELHVMKAEEQLRQEAEANLETQPEETEIRETQSAEAEVRETQPEANVNQEIHVDAQSGDITIQGNNNQGTLKNDMRTLNGRTLIWKASWNALKNNPSVRVWGTEYVGMLISANGELQVDHAHNSWVETLMNLGFPGLMLALIYTAIALWSAAVLLLKQKVECWKKMITVLVLCILVAGFLEPYLFFTRDYYHFIDFVFFFFLGYLDLWRRQALHPERSQRAE